MGTTTTAALLAFALLLLIPYAAMKLIAGRLGQASRNSIIGPIDRVLGFGFGMVKGVIVVVILFSLLVLGSDTLWGSDGRPAWITQARTYPFVNAASDEMVQLIEMRRQRLEQEDATVHDDR
jgi:membrane protein required for colicin V production